MARGGRLRSLFYERIRLFFSYSLALVAIFIIFIVNNGNTLTDGRRYRKRPKIEMEIITTEYTFFDN